MQVDDVKALIDAAIPDCELSATIEGSHVHLVVVSDAFDGLNAVKRQQLVYGAITELMAGQNPAVHAVDRLECLVP